MSRRLDDDWDEIIIDDLTPVDLPKDELEEILGRLYNSAWVEGSNWKRNNPEYSPIPSEREIKKIAHAKQSLQLYIEERERLARIDELNRASLNEYNSTQNILGKVYVTARIEELTTTERQRKALGLDQERSL